MYDKYFDENIDHGLLNYVKATEGFFCETMATPSGTAVIPVDARLVPANVFGEKILVKYAFADNHDEFGYAFFVKKGSNPELEAEHQRFHGGLS